jgi:hypothetical protein
MRFFRFDRQLSLALCLPFILILIVCLTATSASGQCTPGGSFDNPDCAEVYRTLGSAWPCASGHCRVTFGTLPTGWTMVSRTHSNATFFVGTNVAPTTTLFVHQYDSINNCTSSNDWTNRYPQLTYPVITGTIPACPNVGQTYIYYARRFQNGYPGVTESLSWGLTGGTIVGNTSATVAPYTYDTVKVQWNAAGPHRLICTRFGTGSTTWGPQSCTNRDTIWDGGATPPSIVGPSGVCAGATTASYSASSFPTGYTYNWTCSNGTIVSGQGTQNVSVNWTGSGTLTFTSTAVPCGWTAVATKNVNLSASPVPTVNLGPNASYCAGTIVNLNAGAGFPNYQWSNGFITQTALATTTGNYSVTVTNAAGCIGSDTISLTISGSLAPPGWPANQTICAGALITPGSYSTYLWSTGATTSSIVPASSGTYSVTVSNGGCFVASSTTVTVASAPTPNLGPNTSFCQNSGFTLNAGPGTSYNWSTGATTPTITPNASGTYSVTVSNGSCTGSSSVNLTMLPNPVPTISQSPLVVCVGSTAALNAGIWSSYLWSTGATTSSITVSPPGTWSVTVTDGNGCTGSGSISISVLPAPTFSLGADTFICADTFVTLDGPAGMGTYIWSNAMLTSSINVNTGGTYALTVTDVNGCTASDDKVVTVLNDCVFPGDANYDGLADNADILSIGAYYGFTGGTRPGATLQWYGQSLPDWGGALPGSADPKHSDCDGNGTVAAVDTQAVTLNYGLTHNKGAGSSGGPLALVVRALADSVYPGDLAWFVVEMGDAQNVTDSAYGVAFELTPSGVVMATPGILSVDFANCWFAPTSNRLDFTKHFGPNGPVDVAVVRNDQNEQSGFGEVIRFAVATDSNLVAVRDVLQVGISNVHFVDANLSPVPLTVMNGSIVVSHLVTGVTGGHVAPPMIYPNPSDGLVRVYQSGATVLQVTTMDALGHFVQSIRNETGNSLLMDTQKMAAGVYFLRIETSAGTYVKRLMVE